MPVLNVTAAGYVEGDGVPPVGQDCWGLHLILPIDNSRQVEVYPHPTAASGAAGRVNVCRESRAPPYNM